MNDLDVYRCAKLLLDRYSVEADVHAAMRADELGTSGDHDGHRAWLRILKAIDELRRMEPRVGDALH